MKSPIKYISYLEYMLYELENQQLTVELIPSRDSDIAERGGKIRITTEHNPEWYRNLCATYLSTRERKNQCEPDTKIRRQNIIKQLKILILGKDSKSKYAGDLISIAEDIEYNDRQWLK